MERDLVQRFGLQSTWFFAVAVTAGLVAAAIGWHCWRKQRNITTRQFVNLWLLGGITIVFATAGVITHSWSKTPVIEWKRALSGR